jgi:DNA-binding NarL/FixJ family response regulator
MKAINLLIVDDHPVVRDGLKMMLESNKEKFDFKVNEASNAEEAISSITHNDYDVVIMDYKLPGKTGDVITKEVLEIKSKLKIIGLSNYDEEIYASEMLNAGARGYVLKNIDSEELIRAIEKVLEGELYYSAEIANRMISMKLKASREEQIGREKEGLKNQLSHREVEIIKFIVNEHTNEEISKILELSKRTVDNHRQNILTKLNLRNTAGLVRFAVENGILQD